MSIDFNNIKYNNPDLVFVTTGKKIEDTPKDPKDISTKNNIIDVGDLIKGYSKIFGYHSAEPQVTGIAEDNLDGLLGSLGNILGRGSLKIADINASDFYSSAKTISGETIDSNCLEGYRAYSFYLEKIILLLNKLDDAIKQGQDAIKEIEALDPKYMSANQTIEEYVNSKVHELSAELYLADQAIADVKAEFESCLKYNGDTKSWDKSSYEVTGTQFLKPSSLDNLRGIKIAVSNANDPSDTHKIACFSELNLLDRLRYIRYYYELILNGQDSDYQVFPDDPEKGYPCVPDIKSTTDTKATESMGGFELFYVGYLVDRDGSIDAYSSCLEAKSKAITDNISLQSEHIEAYNQYLAFINRATQLLNQSQSKKAAAIANGAHLGLTYFCGGTMRDLLEVDGVNYIVLSYTDKDGSKDIVEKESDFNYGLNHRYLLVRADEKGLKALYNTQNITDPNYDATNPKDPSYDEKADPNNKNIYDKTYKPNLKKLEITTARDLEVLFTKESTQSDNTKKTCNVTYDCPLQDASGENFGYPGTTFYRRAHSTEYSSNCPLIVSSSEENREILIWETYNTENDKKYLPKQLIIQEIEPDSVAAYEDYNNYSETGWGYAKNGDKWEESAEEANRVINSWTTAFSNKSDYINTAIETINTDITALRTKMDTIDSLCSTLRNRSFETKKTLISNLRS